jgi:HK97 family phage major capsid protein
MKTAAEMRQAHADKIAQAEALAAKDTLTEAEATACDTLLAEAADLLAQANAAEAAADRAARVAAAKADAGKPRAARSAPAAPASQPAAVRELAQDDPRRGFRSMGDFAASVLRAQTPGAGIPDERLQIGASVTGLGQTVGADGGFLVPPEFSTAIWDGMNQSADNLLARTDQYTVQGESLTFPANAETSRATGSRYGGVRGYWIAEAGQITSSAPKFRQVKIEPHQLAVLVYATDKLIRNSPVALSQYITRAATEEISFLVGDSIINGTGAGQPKGILAGTAGTSSCRVAVAKETGQAAATIVYANIVKMWARLHARSRAGAVWYVNQDIEPQLAQMTLAVGTGGQPVYLPPGGASGSPYATLFGRPILPIEYAATLGTEGDIILADLKSYASGVQGGVESAMSMHLRFDYAESAFRFMFAVDGQPWLASPITPFKGSNTQSPIVTLATRA